MGLLRHSGRPGGARVMGALALASCAGCMLVDALGPRSKRLAFSHELHVLEEGLECISCHENSEVAEDPGLPGSDACAVCHEPLDAEKPAERAVATLFDGAAFRATRASALDPEVRFEHLAHVVALQDCGVCHRGIEENEAVDSGVAVTMDDCTACHEERALPNDCADCHSYVGRDWAPATHASDWQRLHGHASRRASPPPLDRCALCHEDQTCERCHRIELPEDHTAHFRLRGHALYARVDRSRCAACHETATCERCHEEVLPLSHASALWGSPLNTHCLTCHFPLQDSGCLTCHKGTPSHSLGPPKPAWHDPAMNCRACHGATLPLSHVDDGSNCNLCHP